MLTINGHSDGVHSVVFSPDGKRLATGSSDGTVKLWDAATEQEVSPRSKP
jgi:WD40 repeat protein